MEISSLSPDFSFDEGGGNQNITAFSGCESKPLMPLSLACPYHNLDVEFSDTYSHGMIYGNWQIAISMSYTLTLTLTFVVTLTFIHGQVTCAILCPKHLK